MARLHEYQGKQLLREAGLDTPKGRVVHSPDEVDEVVRETGLPVVVKAQAWTTSRAKQGAIAFADTAEEAREHVKRMLAMKIAGFDITDVLVEEKVDIAREFYAGVIIDDAKKTPLVIFSSIGGSGIEEIAQRNPKNVSRTPVDIRFGLPLYDARDAVRLTGVSGKLQGELGKVLVRLYSVARKWEARSAEINPLVLKGDGTLVACDSRITVDDYAVFRHPELNIEIAREFGRPPTELDRIAWAVEKDDYRGTFYFIEMARGYNRGEGYLGFHGAGGGGSMMSMDALVKRGYKIANFTDTSGNPPASKVYRAAKIILSQPNIDGYFGSGSGVASQEQFHSARGLVKAFWEENLSIPAVIRLGGNQEDRAVHILTEYTKDLPVPVEGYKKDDTADFCAERMHALIEDNKGRSGKREMPVPAAPEFDAKDPYTFDTPTGTIVYDHALCRDCKTKICIETCVPQILREENDVVVLNISRDEAKAGKCTECLACEVECRVGGNAGGRVILPVPGLDEYRQTAASNQE
ncbi:MAG: succinyl-CoA synthetase subunit beta [candidate division Zixibacteria bacterium]|nr:succinyl-CoA synthetase subunit beta [candidate division Zixibacteria bacterium]